MRKTHWIVLCVLLTVVLSFFVASIVLAHIHDNTIVTEWQSWFGIVKNAVAQLPSPEEPAEVVETLMKF